MEIGQFPQHEPARLKRLLGVALALLPVGTLALYASVDRPSRYGGNSGALMALVFIVGPIAAISFLRKEAMNGGAASRLVAVILILLACAEILIGLLAVAFSGWGGPL